MADGYALEARPLRDAVRVLLDARSVATRTAGTDASQLSAVLRHAGTVAVVRRHGDLAALNRAPHPATVAALVSKQNRQH